jgi:hypothetical protein
VEANDTYARPAEEPASGFTSIWGDTRQNELAEQQAKQQAQLAHATAIAEVRTKAWATRFFWVAGLSLVNSISMATGATLVFPVGLGITQVIDELGQHYGPPLSAIAPVLDIAVAGIFVLFGVFARKGHTWAFITGMAIYTLDALLFLLIQDWFAIAFHALILYYLYAGLKSSLDLNKLRAQTPSPF